MPSSPCVPESLGPWVRKSAAPQVRKSLGPCLILLSPFAALAQTEYLGAAIPMDPRTAAFENRPYTLKSGDFRLLVRPSLTTEWNDNVSASGGGKSDDFILRPMVQFDASYPITANNLLRVDIGIGYDQYFENNDLSTWRLQSGSAVSFDMAIEDFTFNLHDRFSYVRDSASQGDVAGSAFQGNLNNTAGLLVNWNLGDVLLSAGYDHANSFSTEDEQSYQDRATELINLRAALQVHPQWLVGVESPLSFTRYDEPVLNDSFGYGGGVYATWKPGASFTVTPRVGYSVYDFDQTSVVTPASDADAWYADLTLSHSPTTAIRYSLSAGRELRLGLQSDAVEAWYVRPSVNWQMMERIAVSPYFTYENGNQGASPYVGAREENYDWYGAGLTVTGSITEKLQLSLGYRYTTRTTDVDTRDYTQNVVSLMLTYSMQ